MDVKRSLLAFALIAGLFVSATACEKAPSNKARKTSAQGKVSSTVIRNETTPKDLAREYGLSTATKTEAMDYFFQTFFSANFREARNVTSVEYRKGKSLSGIENEWRRFYDEAAKNGLNRKNLSYRTDAYANRPHVGVVISPSGRVVMAVLFAETRHPIGNDPGWQIDHVWLFHDTLKLRSTKGRERVDISDRPSDPTHVSIRRALADR